MPQSGRAGTVRAKAFLLNFGTYVSLTVLPMSRPNTLDLIVISDSDPDNNVQPGASSALLVGGISGIPPTANSNATSSAHPATPRGKSEPILRVTGLGPPAETQICRRQTRSLPPDVIDVDVDEPSDGPPVSFQITAFVSNHMRPTNNYSAKTGQN